MGTIIDSSQFPGKCPECEEKFAKGAVIYYQKDPKIACANEECAKEQGWTKTAYSKPSGGGFQKTFESKGSTNAFWNRKELDAVIPEDVKINLTAEKGYLIYFKTADQIANKLYPELRSVDKNTFGQIRSRITSDLIANKG